MESKSHVSLPEKSASGLESALLEAASCIEELGEAFALEHLQLRELLSRLREERFHLAVVGQFKRGKSTLLNALLGEEALPVALLPATAFPTFIRSGPIREARISFLDGRAPELFSANCSGNLAQPLAQFVSQEMNPENRLGVAQVEVFHPSPALRDGMILIDTPGIGSTFEHNSETALEFLPQCDAALFVVSGDPPITRAELDYLRLVKEKTSRVFFALNKSDLLRSAEREESLRFLHAVLRDKAEFNETPEVFCVSARMGLESRRRDDPSGWEASGMGLLERRLWEFAEREKNDVLASAVALKAQGILAGICLRLNLMIRSLEMPIEDLERRLVLFEDKIKEFERERLGARDLLAGDHRRLIEFIEEQAAGLRARAQTALRAELKLDGARDRSRKTISQADAHAARAALESAIPTFFSREARQMASALDAQIADVVRLHNDRAQALTESVRRAAAEIFEIPWRPLDSTTALERHRAPHWVTRQWNTALGMLPVEGLENLLPAPVRRRRFERRLAEEIESLAVHNAENARWAALQNLDDTIHQFADELDSRFCDTLEATRGAIRAALEKRHAASAAAQLELPTLRRAAKELSRMQNALLSQSAPQN